MVFCGEQNYLSFMNNLHMGNIRTMWELCSEQSGILQIFLF